MVLNKRIKVNPRDIDNKDKYYAAAAICPICGTNIREEEESRPLLLCNLTILPKVLYVATRKKVTFFCPTCGCSWSVKQCKRGMVADAYRRRCLSAWVQLTSNLKSAAFRPKPPFLHQKRSIWAACAGDGKLTET